MSEEPSLDSVHNRKKCLLAKQNIWNSLSEIKENVLYQSHAGIQGKIQAHATPGFCEHPEIVMGNVYNMNSEDDCMSEAMGNPKDLIVSDPLIEHPLSKLCETYV